MKTKRILALFMALLLVLLLMPANERTAYAATPKLSVSKASLNVGGTKKLTIKNKPSGSTVTWKSNKTSVCRVKNGRLYAKKEGTATITATIKTASKTYTKKCKVTVNAPVLSTDKVNISGKGITATVSVQNLISGSTVAWSTSKAGVVSLSSTEGSSVTLTGTDGGDTVLTAVVKTKEGNYRPSKTYTLTINVHVESASGSGDTTGTGEEALTLTAGGSAVTGEVSDGVTKYTLSENNATYEISGGSLASPVENVQIEVTGSGVTLKLNGAYIDDSSLTDKTPVIKITGSSTESLTDIVIWGDSKLIGANAKTSVIGATKKANLTLSGSGTLTLSDGTTASSVRKCHGVSAGDGTITVESGTYKLDGLGRDGFNTDGTFTQSGGTITIDNCYGDGVQAENVNISGGSLDITTYYEYAGYNFYGSTNPVDGSTDVNSLTENASTHTKTETIKYDTGSHKGIKAGTKAKKFSYKSVESGSKYTAGTTYSQDASGGLNITGGTITIDTTHTGIKYNSSNDKKEIIGGPEDGIKSNNTASISGGTIKISAADDGISVADELKISGTASVDIETAYEGIEAKTIIVGTNGNSSTTEPSVSVYTLDDGINASSKTLTYVYDDEDEDTYIKTSVSDTTGNSMTQYSGLVTVQIGCGKTHSVTLPVLEGSEPINNIEALGDGIDCNGTFNSYGGKTLVFGMTSGSESPIDTESGATIKGGTVFTAGTYGMGEDFTGIKLNGQYAIYGSVSMTKGGSTVITNSSGSIIDTVSMPSGITYSYMFYTSPEIASSGSIYTVNSTDFTSTSELQSSGDNNRPGDNTGGAPDGGQGGNSGNPDGNSGGGSGSQDGGPGGSGAGGTNRGGGTNSGGNNSGRGSAR